MNKEQELKELIGQLTDFSTDEKLYDHIKSLTIDEQKQVVKLEINIGSLDSNNDTYLKRQIAKIIKIDQGYNGVKIKFIEQRKSMKIAGPQTKFIMISGGKGGIGKTFVTANLATSLTRLGKKVGIIDADVYGASIPTMFTMFKEDVSVGVGNKINPFVKNNIEIISTEFFSEYEKPVLWQGNTLFTMINNFLYQVNWSKDLDFILIDMPTGTGDVLLNLGKELKDAQVLIVSEEDMLSAHMALKTAKAHQDLDQNVFGFIINKKTNDEFAEQYLANQLEIPLLGLIPNQIPDEGYIYEEEETNAKIFDDLANIISSIL